MLANWIRETTTTTGTGAITLGSASSGYQSFATAGIADGDTSYFMAIDGTAWELFLGTYTASGTSLARTTRLSSSTGSAISLTSATVVTAVAPGAILRDDVQPFTTSDTWTKPVWAKTVEVVCIGGGGGGGGGAKNGTTSPYGGGGGGSAALCFQHYRGDDLPSTVTVTVGAGGTGGAGTSSNDTNGTSGAAGGETSFGGYQKAAGGGGGAPAGWPDPE